MEHTQQHNTSILRTYTSSSRYVKAARTEVATRANVATENFSITECEAASQPLSSELITYIAHHIFSRALLAPGQQHIIHVCHCHCHQLAVAAQASANLPWPTPRTVLTCNVVPRPRNHGWFSWLSAAPLLPNAVNHLEGAPQNAFLSSCRPLEDAFSHRRTPRVMFNCVQRSCRCQYSAS